MSCVNSCPVWLQRGIIPVVACADSASRAVQAYYMAAPFAVERAPTVDLCCLRKYRGVRVSMLTDYPV